jgi:enoyl-[acyl-carrier protein] reductase II
MAWVSEAKLASAVSNAGGVGIIAAGNAPVEIVAEQVRLARTLTDRPFGVNVMLLSPHAGAIAEMTAAMKVPVVTTGAGNPGKYMEAWAQAGTAVIPVVPSVAIARRMEASGAVAVVAEGGESGGHVGDTTTMALVPQVADAVRIPVIAAGGIADGRGMAAAFMLGASGIQMGTRFLVATECHVNQTYKNKVLAASDIDTMATGKRLGHPVRSLKTPFARMYWSKEYDSSVTNEELEALGEGSLRLAAVDGDEQNGCFLAGQIAGMVRQEQSAAEIVTEVAAQAEALLAGASSWVR